jgi:hypothetical protein
MVGDLVVAVVADAAPEQDVLCRADAGGDGVPDRRPQRESSPGGVYGTLLSGHGLASARFPVRVRLTHSRPHVGEQSYRAEYWHFRLRGGMGRCCANLAVRPRQPSRHERRSVAPIRGRRAGGRWQRQPRVVFETRRTANARSCAARRRIRQRGLSRWNSTTGQCPVSSATIGASASAALAPTTK